MGVANIFNSTYDELTYVSCIKVVFTFQSGCIKLIAQYLIDNVPESRVGTKSCFVDYFTYLHICLLNDLTNGSTITTGGISLIIAGSIILSMYGPMVLTNMHPQGVTIACLAESFLNFFHYYLPC